MCHKATTLFLRGNKHLNVLHLIQNVQEGRDNLEMAVHVLQRFIKFLQAREQVREPEHSGAQ